MNNVPPVVSTLDCLRRRFLTVLPSDEFRNDVILDGTRQCDRLVNNDMSPSDMDLGLVVIGTNRRCRHFLSLFARRCRDFFPRVAEKRWRIVRSKSSDIEALAVEVRRLSDEGKFSAWCPHGRESLRIERQAAR